MHIVQKNGEIISERLRKKIEASKEAEMNTSDSKIING